MWRSNAACAKNICSPRMRPSTSDCILQMCHIHMSMYNFIHHRRTGTAHLVPHFLHLYARHDDYINFFLSAVILFIIHMCRQVDVCKWVVQCVQAVSPMYSSALCICMYVYMYLWLYVKYLMAENASATCHALNSVQ